MHDDGEIVLKLPDQVGKHEDQCEARSQIKSLLTQNPAMFGE